MDKWQQNPGTLTRRAQIQPCQKPALCWEQSQIQPLGQHLSKFSPNSSPSQGRESLAVHSQGSRTVAPTCWGFNVIFLIISTHWAWDSASCPTPFSSCNASLYSLLADIFQLAIFEISKWKIAPGVWIWPNHRIILFPPVVATQGEITACITPYHGLQKFGPKL